MSRAPLPRRLLAEGLGAALLVAAVVGSGIAAQRLSPQDTGLRLLENAMATGAALIAIILALGSVSGAHLNPVVSLVDAAFGALRWRDAAAYSAAQACGGVVGAIAANAMFSLPAVSVATQSRSSPGLWLAEMLATFGLLLVVFGTARGTRGGTTAVAVGAYIAAAYFFTASTSFANPAVTVARIFSDTFTGIEPSSVPMFLVAQVLGAAAAWLALRVLFPGIREQAAAVVVPHD